MLITDYLRESCIKVDLQSDSKDQILQELAELHFAAHPDLDRAETMNSLLERENLQSTGIGEGIAIPHARVSHIKEVQVSLGFIRKKINFETLDNKPVRIVFLILFPKEDVTLQLRFLARVSRVLQHSRLLDELYKCEDSAGVINAFRKYEEQHFH